MMLLVLAYLMGAMLMSTVVWPYLMRRALSGDFDDTIDAHDKAAIQRSSRTLLPTICVGVLWLPIVLFWAPGAVGRLFHRH